MKKLVYLLFVFFNLYCSCQAESVKFLQVTDVHLSQDNAKYLEQFVSDVNKNYTDLDFIVFTGDNIDKPNPKDLLLFLDIITNLNVRPYILLGNHDLFKSQKMTKESYMYIVQKKLGNYHSKNANFVFEKNNIVFIAMNGVKEVIPGANGYYRQDELVWLDKQLSKYKNKKVVILQHFPLLPTNVANHSLCRQEDYEVVLKKHHNVISIVSGHYHENREEKVGEIYHIVTKNFQNNRYYKIIEINTDDNMIYTSLIDNSED